MKQTIRTLLKDIDDMPVVFFENLDNDAEAQTFQNEYWKWTLEYNKAELKDLMDKKQDFLFGRTFDQWQIVDGKIKWDIVDPQDILVSRYCDPSCLDSSRYLIHTHIFKPLSVLEQNDSYDKEALARLRTFYKSKQGVIKSHSNEQMYAEKMKKMMDLGLSDALDPVLGETYVELSLHFVYRGDKEEQLYLFVEAEDQEILLKKPLEEVIGKTKDNYWRNHFPYNSWADDIDRQDFWTDGVSDIVRPANKILNSWISQLVENRTMRNFGMQFYDSTVADGFNPGTYQPTPFGFYGVPGDPNKIIKRVDIPDLSESLDEISFIIGMSEKATGATATQQGVQTERKVTLGEVQLALGEAKERIKGVSKFYTQAWKERAQKFLKLIEAAPERLDAVKIYKKGKNSDNLFVREIAPKNMMTKSGYTTRIWAQDEKRTQNTDQLEKLNAAVANIPGNPKLLEIYQRKLLEFADVSPDDINNVMFLEEQKRQAMASMNNQMAQPPMQEQLPAPQPQPVAPRTEIIGKLKAVKSKIRK